jgi:aminoglycoside phosphotransferase (APT) family kinase protein
MNKDTAPIRRGEEIDVAALTAYLLGRIPGVEEGIAVEQFPGGHSNLTYCLAIGGKEYVLRRAPLGPVAPKAHDMAREHNVLRAVHPFFGPAPKPYLCCEDPSVIGAVFFLMERRRGIVIRDRMPGEWDAIPDTPQRISRAFVDCLIDLHGVDIQKHGLAGLGKPDGFLARQVHGWADRWYRSRTEESPRMDRVVEWLKSTIPPSNPPTLVHNDFKLDNLMLEAADPGRVVAVFDWEMTTVGDPLADLGLTLCYWDPPDGPVRDGPVPCLTTGPGWMTRQELAEVYARRTGRDLSSLGWHEVLGIFKLAVIVQQIYYRYFKGQTSDERFKNFDVRVRSLIDAAHARLESSV